MCYTNILLHISVQCENYISLVFVYISIYYVQSNFRNANAKPPATRRALKTFYFIPMNI